MEILKSIETVDHTNESAMIRLNDEVYEWLLTIYPDIQYGRYVFSRDALKQIRPSGWYLTLMIDYLGKASYRMSKSGIEFHSAPYFQEERLAELHANIIAIDHERSQP